mmetsp:Transcript_10528/g.23381  ORF Transcript_10528/g.23381 Transcript_10528/m.23381 type:complete len:280 (-) Transcript_10528:294-1133(-)
MPLICARTSVIVSLSCVTVTSAPPHFCTASTTMCSHWGTVVAVASPSASIIFTSMPTPVVGSPPSNVTARVLVKSPSGRRISFCRSICFRTKASSVRISNRSSLTGGDTIASWCSTIFVLRWVIICNAFSTPALLASSIFNCSMTINAMSIFILTRWYCSFASICFKPPDCRISRRIWSASMSFFCRALFTSYRIRPRTFLSASFSHAAIFWFRNTLKLSSQKFTHSVAVSVRLPLWGSRNFSIRMKFFCAKKEPAKSLAGSRTAVLAAKSERSMAVGR